MIRAEGQVGPTVHVQARKEGLEDPLPGVLLILVDAAKHRHEATADATGNAYFHDGAPGSGNVDAVADGWIARWTLDVDVPSEGDAQTTIIRMQTAVVVAGVVRAAASGDPVAAARVVAVAGGRVHASEGWSASSRGEYATVMTDASGRFRCRALPAGEVCTLAALAQGFRDTAHGMIRPRMGARESPSRFFWRRAAA